MKKRGCFWVGIILFGLLMFVVMVNIPYKKFTGDKIVIGEDTTVLKGPVRTDGGIDYMAAINQRQSEGVTHGDNSVVLIFRLTPESHFGFSNETSFESSRDKFAKAIGFEETPPVIVLSDPHDHLREELYSRTNDPLEREEIDNQLASQNREVTKPWLSSQYPEWSRVLKQQAETLDLIVEAASRRRYYHPLMVGVEVGQHPLMMNALLPVGQRFRHCAHMLRLRAMNSLGEGTPHDIESAIRDIQAIRRLGWLQCQSVLLIEKLIAVASFRIATECEEHLLASGKLSAEQISEYRKFLHDHEFIVDVSSRVDQAERMMLLDQTQSLQLYTEETLNTRILPWTEAQASMVQFLIKSADMAEAMRVINRWFDRTVEAVSQETMKQSLAAVNQLEKDFMQLETGVADLRKSGWRMIKGARSRGQIIGEVQSAMWQPTTLQVLRLDFELVVQDKLNQLAFAVAAYRKKHGHFPATLKDLVPEFLKTELTDPLNECSFEYQFSAKGFYVYSKGLDGTDQGGRNSLEMALPGGDRDIRFSAGLKPSFEKGSKLDNQIVVEGAEQRRLDKARERRDREREAERRLEQEKKANTRARNNQAL